ncbi:MAG: hypothetical protein ACOH2H_06785 [Cypionkella sp.]
MPPGFDKAAKTLEITTDALKQALQNSNGAHPDLAAAAKTLRLSDDRLRAVPPPPPGK